MAAEVWYLAHLVSKWYSFLFLSEYPIKKLCMIRNWIVHPEFYKKNCRKSNQSPEDLISFADTWSGYSRLPPTGPMYKWGFPIEGKMPITEQEICILLRAFLTISGHVASHTLRLSIFSGSFPPTAKRAFWYESPKFLRSSRGISRYREPRISGK